MRVVRAKSSVLSIVTRGPTEVAAEATTLAAGPTWQIKQVELSLARCLCTGAASEKTNKVVRHNNEAMRVVGHANRDLSEARRSEATYLRVYVNSPC
jgi:hypothetical protein